MNNDVRQAINHLCDFSRGIELLGKMPDLKLNLSFAIRCVENNMPDYAVTAALLIDLFLPDNKEHIALLDKYSEKDKIIELLTYRKREVNYGLEAKFIMLRIITGLSSPYQACIWNRQMSDYARRTIKSLSYSPEDMGLYTDMLNLLNKMDKTLDSPGKMFSSVMEADLII